ncbi:HET-domain-containing protein [Dendrothele bispora CBS 962.96]|uniref:HET-domain-containing protein n=1 Tax=Dendrothele bispora (strain CBS 962.96) TaxID=1314807 RepID=A0A4S8LIE5_DENBC|nr:HET-domain-containing protein [Dendrothele bispora CBS 962.96]
MIAASTRNMQQIPSSKERPQRLIFTQSGRLADFSGLQTPPYAIISHRWLLNQEVSLQEYRIIQHKPELKKRLGYRKIQEACKKAQDKYKYIWIDTCCIDQSNRNEVAQNVKSMYSYYRNSEVCYVYLADVQVQEKFSQTKRALLRSQWFQRGWTLQELVAPREVLFFDSNWKLIGTKDDLSRAIANLTGIPCSVLEGSTPVHDVDIRTRMSWCAGRKTTEPADLAYCLLGILGVVMDPDYTEDVQSAFKRLQKALIHSYPNTFTTFEDGRSIYQMLVSQNARARVEMSGGSVVSTATQVSMRNYTSTGESTPTWEVDLRREGTTEVSFGRAVEKLGTQSNHRRNPFTPKENNTRET